MDEIDFIIEDYIIQSAIVPLAGWSTADLIALISAAESELQKRAEQAQNEALST